MGMMDGGVNFRDICHKCDCNKNGGSMKRHIEDRNIKICNDCLNKLDDDNGREEFNKYVNAKELKQGLFK